MAPRHKSVCGIEFGREVLTLVTCLPSERAIAGIAISNPLDTRHEAWWGSIGKELPSMVTKMKTGTLPAGCSLPADHAIVKRVVSDSADEETVNALRWELSQQLIAPIDDYRFDFQHLGTELEGNVRTYLATGFHEDGIRRIGTLLKNSHLRPHTLSLDIFALINVFECNYPELTLHPAMLVLGGEVCTKIILTQGGNFVDVEIVYHEGQEFDSHSYTELVSRGAQTLSSLHAARLEGQTPHLFVAGPMFFQEEFRAHCLQSLPGSDTLSPFRALTCRALGEEDQIRYAPQLAVAIGLALQTGDGV